MSGLEKTITYDTADRISSLAYTSGTVTHKSYSFGYDEASNVIRKNQNDYTYDALNRLKTSYEYGWFQKQPKDIAPDYGEVNRDYTGNESVNYSIKAVDSKDYTVVFDAASKSLACDLLTPLWVNKIELHPSVVAHRVKKEDIAIYYSPGSGSGEEWVALDDYDIEKDGETGALVVYFHKAVETRYLKVSSIWDDRDVDNQSVFAFATFTNTVSELFRVWTLSTSHTESYEYDAIGNRVSLNSDGTVSGNEYYKNSMNGNTCRIRKDGEWYYLYDKAGNRIKKGRAVTGTGDDIAINPSEEHWSYTWDLHNRLVMVESSTGVSVSYAYDAQNHRVKREGKDGTTVYAYGRNGALTYQKNLTSGLERSYTYLGNTILGWTETVNGESHKFFAVTDALGSVTQIRDEENTVVWDGEYAPFGTLTAAVGKKRFNGMFTGKDIDPETGLTYHWHRWRSEDGASFISEDPARDGINWYGYAGANPLRWIDPTGLYYTDPANDPDWTNTNGIWHPKTLDDGSNEGNSVPENSPDLAPASAPDAGPSMSGPPDGTPVTGPGNMTGDADNDLGSRVKMGEDGIPDSGPCLFMAYLGVAQTFAKDRLKKEQITELLNDESLYTKEKGAEPGKKVIEAALEMLGVDAVVEVSRTMDVKDYKSNPAVFATVRNVLNRKLGTKGHWQEGTRNGGFYWDPLDGYDDTDRTVYEIRDITIIRR